MHPRFRTVGLVVLGLAAACADGVTPPDGNGSDSIPTAITVTGESSVDIAGTLQLSATAQNAAGESVAATISWGSSDTDVATVDASGLVSGLARGTVTITASTEGATGTVQDTQEVTVVVAEVTISPALDTLTSIGDTLVFETGALDALGNPVSDVPVVLSATNPSAVSLGGDTLVAVGSGTAEITAEVDGRTAGATVVVRQVATALSMATSVDTLVSLGETRSYTATATDARGNAITDGFDWTSTDPAVASISGSSNAAEATAEGNGATTIRVERDGQQAEATLVVDQQVAAVAVTPATASVLEGFTEQLSASAEDARGNGVAGAAVTWQSSDPSVAAVDGSGLVTGEAPGSATVTATADGESGSADITVTELSFAQHVQPVFTNNCALSGCHAGASPAQGMNLSAGSAYGNIVNVQSAESSLLRIEPLEPDSSYLIHKVQGTQASVGGSGSQMPLGGPALSQETIDVLRAWVRNGAPNN
ncbi:MAG: Ig-like domain-containing protein [Gemmatimonadales bacterium]|jgi:uncharacterized protein YjdB